MRELFFDGVGDIDLVEIVRFHFDVIALDDFGGDAHRRAVGRDLVEDYGARRDLRIVSDRHRTEYFCTRPDHDVVAERRMSFAGVLSGPAQRDALIDRAVIADDRRFADDDAGPVVNEKPSADLRTGVDLDVRLPYAAL